VAARAAPAGRAKSQEGALSATASASSSDDEAAQPGSQAKRKHARRRANRKAKRHAAAPAAAATAEPAAATLPTPTARAEPPTTYDIEPARKDQALDRIKVVCTSKHWGKKPDSVVTEHLEDPVATLMCDTRLHRLYHATLVNKFG
jgi:hypothetical protein